MLNVDTWQGSMQLRYVKVLNSELITDAMYQTVRNWSVAGDYFGKMQFQEQIYGFGVFHGNFVCSQPGEGFLAAPSDGAPPSMPVVVPVGPQIPVASGGIMLPLWLLCVLFALYPLRCIYHNARRKHQYVNGSCFTCGYDLRASKDRCPECGHPIPPA
jgi:hypothetical protein